MRQGPLCYIPKFMEISLLVPKKKILKSFSPYMEKEANWSYDQHYISLYLKVYIQNLARKVKWILRKTNFNFDGQKLRNDLDLEYSYTFIYSSSCLHLTLFRSQAAVVKKQHYFHFFL